MMIQGRRISDSEVLVTTPFPRRGDGMFLRAQLVAAGDSTTQSVRIQVFTRDTDESWPADPVEQPSSASAAELEIVGGSENDGAVYELHIPPSGNDDDSAKGLREELRLKVIGATEAWMTIRIFPPIFYDAVDAVAP